MYVGEGLTIKAAASDPLREQTIIDAIAACEFYAPGKNAKDVPADRVPDYTLTLVYNSDLSLYVGYIDTTGWAAGKWQFKVTLSGAYDAWEYGSFHLKA